MTLRGNKGNAAAKSIPGGHSSSPSNELAASRTTVRTDGSCLVAQRLPTIIEFLSGLLLDHALLGNWGIGALVIQKSLLTGQS
jgi:hypothetical protein